MSDDQQAPERDPLVKKFAYEWVCFNHDVNDKYPYLVTDITDDCMIELEGMSGLFAPSCFHLVPAPPTPGADGRYCRHHDDDPAHTKECYKPPADLAPVAQPPEQGWLLEKMHEGNVHYISADYVLRWTDDPNKALRLARREDAEALTTIVEDCEKIAEHEWVPRKAYLKREQQ